MHSTGPTSPCCASARRHAWTAAATCATSSAAAEQIGTHLKSATKRLTVIVRSTVPPGSVEGVVAPAIERASGLTVHVDFDVAMCPEFLREGQGVSDFYDPELIVIGCEQPSAARTIAQLFSSLPVEPVVTAIRTAEAIKYACNAYHAVKITFANEIGRLLPAMDVDAREVMRVFCEDDRLNISAAYLRPGFSFGGSCLPKDLRALMHIARVADVDLPMLNGVMRSNESHRGDVDARGARHRRASASPCSASASSRRPTTCARARTSSWPSSWSARGSRSGSSTRSSSPTRLFGANRPLRRDAPAAPAANAVLDAPEEAFAAPGVAVVATSEPGRSGAVLDAPPRVVLDLYGSVGPELEALPGYRGIAW